jgi:ceramide glucosyltransferase
MGVDKFAFAIEIAAASLTVCGMAYGLIALWAVRRFERDVKRAVKLQSAPAEWPGVTLLKPMKGVDARMYAGLVSHCLLTYPGEVELLFGVSSLEDPAVAEIARLRVEFSQREIRVVECPQMLGANGKVSNLAQMLGEARYEHVVVNDSDIRVASRYLERVMEPFAFSSDAQPVGLVTLPYVGRAVGGLWSKLEALGISTEFMVGVLTARMLEGGVRFGLGSTLATTKTALAKIGGFEALVDELADDYELGSRLAKAGYRVELISEVVETSVPAYSLRGFCEHQLRWSRGVRDSRKAGYFGLGITYMVPWALLAVIASGGELWSLSLLSMALLLRLAVALSAGVSVLNDVQVVRWLLLVPVRDCFGLFFWAWSYASDEVVWRGQRFRLKNGRLESAERSN